MVTACNCPDLTPQLTQEQHLTSPASECFKSSPGFNLRVSICVSPLDLYFSTAV